MMVSIKFAIFTGVEVAFQEPVLTVGESDGSVSVCTILSGQIETDVLVTYVTLNGSAGGWLIYIVCSWLMAYCTQTQCTFLTAGSDYFTVNGQLVFRPEMANQPQCVDLSIISDETLEVNEFFSVMLVNGSVRVDLSQPVTTITILDNDSKL